MVQGLREPEDRRDADARLARQQAERITREARRGYPLERLYGPVCPKIVGIDDAVAKVILDRIKANASALGLATGDQDCAKNIVIAFVPDVETALADLLENDPWAFGGLRRYQRDRVEKETGPTRAWHASVIGSQRGIPFTDATGAPRVNRINTGSRIIIPVTQLIVGSVVLIQQDATDGKTIQQIADFATFRALAPVDSDGLTLDSILSLFDVPVAPSGLTSFDRAYLSAFYSTSTRNLSSANTMSTIGSRYADAEAKANASMDAQP